jgi:hypothetical protein
MEEQLTVYLGKFITRHLRGGKLSGRREASFTSTGDSAQTYFLTPLSRSMQELPSPATYRLEATITRPDVVEWLRSLIPDNSPEA